MAEEISRKIRFGVMDVNYKGQPVDIQQVFSIINSLDFVSGERYHETSEGINLAVIPETTLLPIKAVIGDSIKKALPLIETLGKMSGLALPNVKIGLFDGSHFIIFENQYKKNIIAYEYNYYAPKANKLVLYIMEKCNNIVDYCAISPIEQKDIFLMLEEIKFPTKFFIKAYKYCDFKNLNKSLASAFEAMRDVTDADSIGLTLSRERGRKTQISMNNFDKIGKFMRTSDAENIENFKITYKDLKNEETVTIDLLDMFLYDTAKVSQIDAVHKSVDTKSMYKALEASIKKNLAVLQEIQ